MSLGQTLKAAREAKGLSTSQLAQQTHLLVQIVEGLEAENFSRIPAPIYGRGFVKIYAEAVGLDPLPLQQEFTLLYKGEKPSAAPLIPTPPPVAPPPEPKPEAPPPAPLPTEPAMPQPTPVVERMPTQQETTPPAAEVEEPVIAPATDIPPSVQDLELFNPEARQQPPLPKYEESPFASSYETDDDDDRIASAAERFRAGLSSVSHGVLDNAKRIPRSVWRMALLGVACAIVLILAAWGCIALYKVTSPDPTEPQDPAQAKPAPQAAAKEKPKAADAEKPKAKPADTQKAKPAEKPKAKPDNQSETKPSNAPKSKSNMATKAPLRSTGQKIPPLYVD